MISSTNHLARARESTAAHTTSSKRLTPFEKDTQAYGKAGATVIGGARALADLAGASVSLSPKAQAAAASEPAEKTATASSAKAATAAKTATATSAATATASSASSPAGHGVVEEIGEFIDAAGKALEGFGDDVADVSKKVVSEAAAAYGAVVGMADSVGEAVNKASHAVSGWASDVADEVSDIAESVVDGFSDAADNAAGYTLVLMAL